MNEEIVRALLRVKHAIKDNVLTNADLVDTFLKDMFPDDKYVGDRMLLLTLMREGLPLKARDGCFDDETALNAEARRIAQTYHMDEDWVRKALLTWRYVAQADESMTTSGHVDADSLQLLSGSVPELKEVDASPVSNRVDESLSQPLSDPLPNLKEIDASSVSAPQTAGGGRKGRSLVLWAVLIFAGLTVWHFAWYSVTGESASSYLAKKRYAAEQEKLKGAQSGEQDGAFLGFCRNGTADEVRKALASGANVNVRDKTWGWTALMWAASYNPNPEVVKVLLENGADINARSKEGITALMEAARWNSNPEVVTVLLENGADVHATDRDGHDTFWWAQQREKGDREKIIQILKGEPSVQGAISDGAFLRFCSGGTVDEVRKALDSGANVNARGKNDVTALMSAAWANSNPEVVKTLLAGGADVNARNKYGETALMLAAWANSNPEMIKALLAGGADVNAVDKNDETALMKAVSFNRDPEVVKVLLENGADVRAVDKDGHDTLWYAERRAKGGKGKKEIIRILKEYLSAQDTISSDDAFLGLCKKGTAEEVRSALADGANVNAKDKNNMTALMLAAEANPNPEVMKVLLEGKADIHARDKRGMTALMFAAGKNTNPEVVKTLLEGKADIHAKTEGGIMGMTALMLAAGKNTNPEVVKVLLGSGADINARGEGDITALMLAAGFNPNPEVVKVLLGSGADVNAKEKDGATALMYAAGFYSNPEVVKVLLANGADIRAVDKDGHDALWWAERREKKDGQEEIIQILKEYTSAAR